MVLGLTSSTHAIGTLKPSSKTVTNWSFVVPSAQPVSLSLDVISKHVKPHKGELARVRATASSAPARFSFAVYRGPSVSGQPVYVSAEQVSASGSLELVWNGYGSTGQPVANGSYTMLVTARNPAGSSATGTAQIVVNFQGGQSLLPTLQFIADRDSWLNLSLNWVCPVRGFAQGWLRSSGLPDRVGLRSREPQV